MTVPTALGGPFIVDNRLIVSLTIGGVEMIGPAWQLAATVLLDSPNVRGTNRDLPGATGVKGYPKRGTQTQYTLDLPLNGFVQQNGTPYPNPWVGFETNWYLLRGVCDPINSGDGAALAVMTLPSGATKSARLQPMGVKLGKQVGPVAESKFTFMLPFGALA